MEKESSEVVQDAAPIEQKHWEALKAATATEHAKGMPPTFPTVYRDTEFEWLELMGMELKNLLHAEQTYEYLLPLPLGAKPHIRTYLKSKKERAMMVFVTLESEIRYQDAVAVRATSLFVIRQERGQG